MHRLLIDADIRGALVRGLRRSDPTLNLLRVQDVGLRTASDQVILDHAATEGRVVVTHDASTMPPAAWERVAAGSPMPGLLVVAQQRIEMRRAIDEILVFARDKPVWITQLRIIYIPLR